MLKSDDVGFPSKHKERLRRALGLPRLEPVELPKPPQSAALFDTEVPVPEDGFDPLDALSAVFVGWFDARVYLDAKALALRRPPQWNTTVNALHRDCCQWLSEHDPGFVPPDRDEFRNLLRELNCNLRKVHDVLLVSYVGLKEDVTPTKPSIARLNLIRS